MNMHPMSTAAVLNSALVGLARNWNRLIVPALIGSVPAGAGAFAIFNLTDAGALVRVAIDTPEGFQALPTELRTRMITDFSLGAAAALALLLLGLVFIFVATHLIVAAGEVSREGADEPDGAGLLRHVWLAYPRTLISATIAFVGSAAALGLGVAIWSIPFAAVGLPNGLATGVAVLSLILVLLPGMWLMSSVSMTTAVSTLESTPIIASIQRSAALVRGRVGSTLAYLLLVGSLAGLAVVLVQVVAIPLVASSEVTFVGLLGLIVAVAGQGALATALGVMFSYWYLALGRDPSRR